MEPIDQNTQLSKLIMDFYSNPNEKIFNSIVEQVNLVNCKGAINKDFIDTKPWDVVHIACVKKGIKPVALIGEYDEALSMVSNFENIKIKKIYKKTIVYNDEEKAMKLYNHLLNSKNKREDNEHHQILGECLGYPQDDINYFINNSSEYWAKRKN